MSFFKDVDPFNVHHIRLGEKVVWTRLEYLVEGIRSLPYEARREVLSHFCKGCGDFDPDLKCTCMAED